MLTGRATRGVAVACLVAVLACACSGLPTFDPATAEFVKHTTYAAADTSCTGTTTQVDYYLAGGCIKTGQSSPAAHRWTTAGGNVAREECDADCGSCTTTPFTRDTCLTSSGDPEMYAILSGPTVLAEVNATAVQAWFSAGATDCSGAIVQLRDARKCKDSAQFRCAQGINLQEASCPASSPAFLKAEGTAGDCDDTSTGYRLRYCYGAPTYPTTSVSYVYDTSDCTGAPQATYVNLNDDTCAPSPCTATAATGSTATATPAASQSSVCLSQAPQAAGTHITARLYQSSTCAGNALIDVAATSFVGGVCMRSADNEGWSRLSCNSTHVTFVEECPSSTCTGCGFAVSIPINAGSCASIALPNFTLYGSGTCASTSPAAGLAPHPLLLLVVLLSSFVFATLW